jgi:hypothetical protein
MPSKTDLQLVRLAGEIEATQLVLVAYLAGIADASAGGRHHVQVVFRMAGRMAETAAELADNKRHSEHARRVLAAIEALKDLTL